MGKLTMERLYFHISSSTGSVYFKSKWRPKQSRHVIRKVVLMQRLIVATTRHPQLSGESLPVVMAQLKVKFPKYRTMLPHRRTQRGKSRLAS